LGSPRKVIGNENDPAGSLAIPLAILVAAFGRAGRKPADLDPARADTHATAMARRLQRVFNAHKGPGCAVERG